MSGRNSYNIDLDGEDYYSNDSSAYKKLQIRFGSKFVSPRYITIIVLATIFDFLIIITDLILRLYSISIKSLWIKQNIFCLVIVLRLILTIQMVRNSNRRMKEKQEDEINYYSKRMDEQLEREKTVRKHIQDQLNDNQKKIQLLTGDFF
ncbi:hypothetical protein LY90DRAFT_664780 [Neocallimastix californiae]|uniref:Uncharacterized protein n=1 Tax=Neocallimastix californiae TaxID=1754190 RepID=A0A1Y2F6P2_9FUNG|nr:hypothetical protein LY90DRAFT_664780 [Neocallimastix californiae]|eukprot:ORY79154.1 hypothetical protein LY90DRAFT_664780 [Neocallimastix californiae]